MKAPIKKIRLLMDSPRTGSLNMAVDEILGREVVGKGREMIVRFYGWEPSTLSIGYNQSHHDLDLAALEADSLGWVRRMTGGGGVLHWNEITYSFAIPYDRESKPSRNDLFSFCADLLAGCYGSLGIRTRAKNPGRYSPTADCFAAPGAYELVEESTGKKIAGSASTIKRGYFLQHGSLPLDDTHRRIGKYLTVASSSDSSFEGSVSIGEFVSLGRVEILERFRKYLEEVFEVTTFEASEEMLAEALNLAAERYAN
ncbi:MAG: hypothetical protein RAO92_06215 [Candidatus Euphemobacter frigidus]|nr:hypothetical protein [Candidatus Euphemobacter frigidus]MDP8275980.1 hypothetical protein [Candidatus Euphemobacter frigidus]